MGGEQSVWEREHNVLEDKREKNVKKITSQFTQFKAPTRNSVRGLLTT